MRRIQMYIDEALDDALRQAAAIQGRSAASVVRDAVRSYLQSPPGGAVEDPFGPIIGAYEGGPDNAAEQHDRYLYREDMDRAWNP